MQKLEPAPTIRSIPGPHDICRQELSNGIVILVRENHTAPSVVIQGLLRVGAIDTQPHRAGLARLAASTLLRGSENYSYPQIFEEIESVGASLAFSAGQHTTEFGARCLSEDLELLLDIIRDALRAPAFPEEQVDRVRGQTITRIQIRDQNTQHVAELEFARLAYPAGHPYSRSATGTIETVSGLSRQDVVDFYQAHYGPRGMVLSIVGDVQAATLLPRLEQRLGDWSSQCQAPQASLPPTSPLDAKQERFVPLSGKTQSDIVLGVPGPTRAASDFLHARLANTILGVFGLMGRLGATVRDERGLAYYAYSEMQGGLGPGPWMVSAGVSPSNIAQAVECIRDEIRRMQIEPVPAGELADNKSFLVGSMPLHLETNEGVCGTILDMELYGLGLDYLIRYPDMIQEIQADQVQAAAQRYLDPDRFALAIAGPPMGDRDE